VVHPGYSEDDDSFWFSESLKKIISMVGTGLFNVGPDGFKDFLDGLVEKGLSWVSLNYTVLNEICARSIFAGHL
jgi:hypothetical protein